MHGHKTLGRLNTEAIEAATLLRVAGFNATASALEDGAKILRDLDKPTKLEENAAIVGKGLGDVVTSITSDQFIDTPQVGRITFGPCPGNQNDSNITFCTSCGTQVDEAEGIINDQFIDTPRRLLLQRYIDRMTIVKHGSEGGAEVCHFIDFADYLFEQGGDEEVDAYIGEVLATSFTRDEKHVILRHLINGE